MKLAPTTTTVVHRLAKASAAAVIALAALLQCPAWVDAAGLTYDDTEADPVFGANATPQAAFEFANTGTLTAGLWDLRVFAANGTVYEATAAETVPEITQTLSGLTPSANYDVYVVYWIDALADWTIRAGFSSGTGPIYNKLGPTATQPDAIAGTFASSGAWTVPPPANIGQPPPPLDLFRESNRSMAIGKIGTTAAAGDGTLPVFINGGASVGPQRAWLDGLAYVEAGTNVFLGATIERSTGNLTISNATDLPFSIKSYTISSAAGSLNSTTWSMIGTDSDGDAWSVVAPAAPDTSTTTLTETETAAPLVPGKVLTATTGQLNLGNAWRRTPLYEDVVIELTLADADETLVTITPQYTGAAPKLGDLNLNGALDIPFDYATLISNLHVPLPAETTLAEAYALGDLTGDGAINFADFNAFRIAYDLDNGAGAFAAAVPEPAAIALATSAAMMGGCCWLGRRRRQRRRARGTEASFGPTALGVRQLVFVHSQEFSFMRFGNCVLHLVAVVGAGVGLSLAVAIVSAAPVTGWTKDPLNNSGSPTVPLSGAATDSPVLGDGVTNLSADKTVIYATIPLTTLAIGQQITLSGTVTMVGVAQRDQVFRWGLFKDDGAAPATGGWLGYIGESGNGGDTGPLWSRDPAGTSFTTVTHMSITNNRGVAIGTAMNPHPGPMPADGTYDFVLTVGKYDNQIHAVVSASLIGAGGFSQVWNQATETVVTRVTTSFDRVSLLAASVSDAEQMAFSGIDVTTSAIVAPKLQVVKYAGETSVIRILNGTGQSIDLTYYQINSTAGALSATGWNSLDQQEGGDPVGTGWEEAGGSLATILSEGNLQSVLAFANGASLNLGRAFAMAGAEDLTFSFAGPDGHLKRGLIEYVPGVLGDVNFDGIVDIFDVNLISSHWNETPGGASAVPEPATWLLLSLGGAFVLRGIARRA